MDPVTYSPTVTITSEGGPAQSGVAPADRPAALAPDLLDEALDLITELVGFLSPWTSVAEEGEAEMAARARAFLLHYRPETGDDA